MTDTAIKANEREAQRLFERGVAAARGGQRRVAAGLLARAVQLNPRHEAGWLWLSGTLDSPKEIAFCLQSVLAINPENQRARQGLVWLDERGRLSETAAADPQPAPAAQAAAQPALDAEGARWWQRASEGLRVARPVDAHAVIEHELHAHAHGESWWVNFRRTRRDMSRVRVLLWSVPILLLALTLALNIALRSAVERNEQLARDAAVAAARPPAPAPPPAAPAAEMVLLELPASDDARALAYLSALAPARDRLRAAVEEYRAVTGRPGGSSTTHAAAARKLRDTIEQSYTTIEALDPPPGLSQAHAYYLSGLETEQAALDDMLTFYGSFSVEIANRAAVRMAEADQYLERARKAFDERRANVAVVSVPSFTAR